MQLQISSCTSRCQGVTQVQQATQSNAAIQLIGSAGQVAGAVTQPASGATTQVTSTIIQIQLGCLSQCFGTPMSQAPSAALIQLLLSSLSSFLSPSGSSGGQPAPAVEQNIVEQIAWQLQDGTPGSQLQSASQTNVTVQITQTVTSGPAYGGSTPTVAEPPQPPQPAAVDQTGQQTWQLQIGCLFYCVDSQQVQQAQESTTTIQIVEGPPGSATTVAVVQQTIWQVQVGCLAWCWNSTQVQEASTESTISVLTVPPATDGPGPAPGPIPGPPPGPGPGGVPRPGPGGVPLHAPGGVPLPGAGGAPVPGPGSDPLPGAGPAPAPGSGSGVQDPGSAPGGTTSPPGQSSASFIPPPRIAGASGSMPAGATANHAGRRATVYVLTSPVRAGLAMLVGLPAVPASTTTRPLTPVAPSALVPNSGTIYSPLNNIRSTAPVPASMAARLSARSRHLARPVSARHPFVTVTRAATAPGADGGGESLLILMLAAAGILSLAAIARQRSLRQGWR